MKISTKRGDEGKTRLFNGEVVSKASLIVEVLGEIDELQCFLGWCRSVSGLKDCVAACKVLDRIQENLYEMMAELGEGSYGEGKSGGKNLNQNGSNKLFFAVKSFRAQTFDIDSCVGFLEKEITKYEKICGKIDKFLMPGQNEAESRFSITRCVCRRAERALVRYVEAVLGTKKGGVSAKKSFQVVAKIKPFIVYLNRLSDLLFLMGIKCLK